MPQNDASVSIIKGRPKLAEERARHHWSQRDLAEQIGTTVVSVSRWERGITEPGMYYRQQLAGLFDKSAEEIELLLAVEEDINHSQGEDAADEQQNVSLDPLPLTALSADEQEGTRDSPDLSIILAPESLSDASPTSSQLIPLASQPLVNSSKHSNRQRLLNKVHMFWIRGLLEHSLQKAILIQLGLLIRPEAVLNPWQMVLKVTSSGLARNMEGMCILDIYDEVAGELLIWLTERTKYIKRVQRQLFRCRGQHYLQWNFLVWSGNFPGIFEVFFIPAYDRIDEERFGPEV